MFFPYEKESQTKFLVMDNEGVVITFDESKEIEQSGIEISIVPAWKYFLSNGFSRFGL